MCPTRRSTHFIDILGYTVPRLHEGKKWYVDFYTRDPETGAPRRKKYYITARTKTEKRRLASELIDRLMIKLRQGWSPWALNSGDRAATLFDDILNKYITSLESSHRLKSVQTYASKANILRQYIKEQRLPAMYALHFDRMFVTDFLDWLLEERGLTARSRNNYRGWLFTLGEYMVERSYLTDNPVAKIKNITEAEKTRQPLTETMLRELFAHLRRTDRHYLLAVMMEYYTFIRPGELRHIRISYISYSEMTVYIPAEISKNKKPGKVAINEEIIRLMIELRIHDHPSDAYLFGPDFLPNRTIAPSDIFNKRFAQVRKQLKWTSEYKFYSLKDSGIRDLTQSAGILTARDQARHSDISTTNRYLQGHDRYAPEAAKHFKGSLS